jgi:DNA primase
MDKSDFKELKEKAKQKDITEYLSQVGIKPKSITGHNYWYASPVRGSDNDPSFKVNTNINKWYDFGSGEKGDVIDLVIRLENKSFLEAMKSLVNSVVPNIDPSFSFGGESKEPKLELHRIKPLNNPALIEYVKSRTINPKLAAKYFEEAYYYIKGKHFFSLAIKNDKGGYELNNRYFKGSVSPKYFTTIEGSGDGLNIFEGCFDFLASLEYFQVDKPNYTTIILNSLSFIDDILPNLKNYRVINSYLDNDTAGKKALDKIRSEHRRVKNWSSYIYPEYEDFNDYLKSKLKCPVG